MANALFRPASQKVLNVTRSGVAIRNVYRNGQCVFHKHTGNKNTGGGCFTAPDVHRHDDSCYIRAVKYYEENGGWYHGAGDGGGHSCCNGAGPVQGYSDYIRTYYDAEGKVIRMESGTHYYGWTCGYCGPGRADQDKGWHFGNFNTLTCTKEEGTQSGFKPACGKVDHSYGS